MTNLQCDYRAFRADPQDHLILGLQALEGSYSLKYLGW